MRIVRLLCRNLKKMELSSVIIIKVGLSLCAAVYMISAVLYVVLSFSDFDYTTGMFWIRQISLFGARLLLDCTFPVFITELMYIYRGLK